MDTRSLDLVCNAATAAGSKGTVLEILAAKERKEKFIRKHRNGTGSKMVHKPKGAKAKAKEKERKAGRATATPNPFATIGARGMGTAAMQQLATSRTMVPKEVIKEKGKRVNIITGQSREKSKERNHGNGD